MTEQIKDQVVYKKKTRCLSACTGKGLFNPSKHGIKPEIMSTACHRGFHCQYEIIHSKLLLTQFYINLNERDLDRVAKGKLTIFNQVPKRYTQSGSSLNLHTNEVKTSWESWDFKVEEIEEPISFTGGFLLGFGDIPEINARFVFYPGYNFQTVHELILEEGKLLEEHDRSSQMAEFREMILNGSLNSNTKASRKEIEKRFRQCFRLKYSIFGD
jgi:hypothetical protein